MRSDRLELWPVRPTDAHALHQFWISPEVWKFLWDDIIINRGRTEEIVSKSEQFTRVPPEIELLLGVNESQ